MAEITKEALAEIVKANTKALDRNTDKLDDYDERLRAVENDITALKTKVNVWSGINSIGALVLAGFYAAFGIKQ